MTRVGVPSAVTQSRPASDIVTLLTFYLVVLFGVPSGQVVGPLGGAGSPAQIMGLVLAIWWAAYRLSQTAALSGGPQPIRRAALLFGASVLASYIAAATRPIADVELRAADRGLLGLVAWLGILLATMDGVPSRLRLEVLIRRLVAAGGALATLGILQYFTHRAFVDLIHIPGLSANSALVGVFSRNGISRPAGTALHPIEFGVVLTMVLPLAIHLAIHETARSWYRRWYPLGAIALAIPMSVSRSAIVGTALVLAVLVPTWSGPLRRRAVVVGVAALPVIYISAPGLLGTLRNLFTGIGSDSSALSRTGSYQLAGEFISRAPIFGRGFGTFLPEYRILDNQYLLTTIETGLVGVLALLGLFVTGFISSRQIRRWSTDSVTRDLAQSLAAALATGGVSFALFDTLSFPMAASLVFLLLGCAGALRRLTRPDEASTTLS